MKNKNVEIGQDKQKGDICQILMLQDCNETNLGKSEYLILVREALHKKNENMLRLLATGKCERIIREDYGKKQYISTKDIVSVRQKYRTRFG